MGAGDDQVGTSRRRVDDLLGGALVADSISGAFGRCAGRRYLSSTST
jgi:hypothetical protein